MARIGSDTILALGVVAVAPLLFATVPAHFWPDLRLPGLVVLQVLYCGLVPFIIWVVRRREHLPLRSIGFKRPTLGTWLWASALLVFVVLVLPALTSPLVARVGHHEVETELAKLAAWPLWFRVLVGATGGVVEETLYRGYMLERLMTVTGRPLVAAVISVAIFTLAHVPTWGLGFALAADLPFGVVMTAAYLWRRDLVANALAHSAGLVISLCTIAT